MARSTRDTSASRPVSRPRVTCSKSLAARSGEPSRSCRSGLESFRAGQTGLLHISWDNGDRTVLVNPNLGGVTLGWNLNHTAQDHLFAAIEGTAFHTRVILERMAEYGVPIERVIHGGGIPQKNDVLNQRLRQRIRQTGARAGAVDHQPGLGDLRVPRRRNVQQTIEEAQRELCPTYRDRRARCARARDVRTTIPHVQIAVLRDG